MENNSANLIQQVFVKDGAWYGRFTYAPGGEAMLREYNSTHPYDQPFRMFIIPRQDRQATALQGENDEFHYPAIIEGMNSGPWIEDAVNRKGALFGTFTHSPGGTAMWRLYNNAHPYDQGFSMVIIPNEDRHAIH